MENIVYLCRKLVTMPLNIKEAIKRYGLTSKEVATRMGVTPVGLSQHINGNPSVAVLERIATAIGCDISELFDTAEPSECTIACPHCGKAIKVDMAVKI